MSLTVIAQRMSKTSFQRLVTGLVLSTLLVGCSSNKSSDVRVVDRNNAAAQRPAVTTGQYVVRPKDTLFSIAFRYGWDYKALAARNNIPAPYTIHPGQTIRFDGRSDSTSRSGRRGRHVIRVPNYQTWFGMFQLRYFGRRPLIEDNSVRSRRPPSRTCAWESRSGLGLDS